LASKAVDETRGIVALYDGKPIDAKYHSTCGGFTSDNENEWQGSPVGYLRGGNDGYGCIFARKSYCADSKHSNWEHAFDKEVFINIIDSNAKKITKIDGNIKSIRIKDKDKYGRVISVSLLSTTGSEYSIKGLNIRKLFSGVDAPGGFLRSRYFKILKKGDKIVIAGKGFGHGVGMCQYGAMGMAEKKNGYQKILKHYYRGITLRKLY